MTWLMEANGDFRLRHFESELRHRLSVPAWLERRGFNLTAEQINWLRAAVINYCASEREWSFVDAVGGTREELFLPHQITDAVSRYSPLKNELSDDELRSVCAQLPFVEALREPPEYLTCARYAEFVQDDLTGTVDSWAWGAGDWVLNQDHTAPREVIIQCWTPDSRVEISPMLPWELLVEYHRDEAVAYDSTSR